MDNHPPRSPALELASLSDAAQAYWMDGYSHGYAYGINAGRAQVQAELEADWARMREHIRTLAKQPDYAELQRRRAELGVAANDRRGAA